MTPTGIVLYHGIDSGPELAGYGRMAKHHVSVRAQL